MSFRGHFGRERRDILKKSKMSGQWRIIYFFTDVPLTLPEILGHLIPEKPFEKISDKDRQAQMARGIAPFP